MENKEVTYKNLKVGQEINGHKLDNSSSSYSAIVTNINPSYITILKWGKYEEKVDSRSLFYIELTNEEYENKYKDKVIKILKSLKNKLLRDEIGYHEMWNVWLYGTIYEMAEYCTKNKMEVIGYCSAITPKTTMFSEDILDIGVCAESENGERFWCHYRYSDLVQLLEQYKSLINEEEVQ